MVMLEAAMAFAVVMIVLSTLVTGVVEFIHQCLGTRAKHLKTMSQRFFQQVVWPRLGQRLQDDFKIDLAGAQAAFEKAMVSNPLADEAGTLGGKVDSLTPGAFVERLARTEVGQAIMKEADGAETILDDIVTDFAQQFDRYGRAASEFVASRARTMSLVVGCALAVIINVDAERLISALMKDPGLRSELIDQVETANAENRKALDSLDAVIAQHAEGGPVDLDSLKAAREEFQLQVQEVHSIGLPIGWDYFPYCQGGSKLPACDGSWLDNLQAYPKWALMVLVAGLLVGLGGPFWYDVFKRLASIRELAGALAPGQKADPLTQRAAAAEEAAAHRQALLDAFKVSARVAKVNTLTDG